MSIVEEIENLIRPALSQNQFELIETQYRKESGKWVLRIFIDKPAPQVQSEGQLQGVTLDDCENASHIVGQAIDSSSLISDSYVLEVSSPGINRPLKNETHFQRYIGQKIRVSLYGPLLETSKQKNFSGILLGCKENEIEMQDIVSGRVKIPIGSIAKAHLDLI